jgi:arsenic resistance protein ArsH
MRVLGRWMLLITILNQPSVAKAFQKFDETGRMKASSYYDRVVGMMEELVKFTLFTRGCSDYRTSRYSEHKERAERLTEQTSLNKT